MNTKSKALEGGQLLDAALVEILAAKNNGDTERHVGNARRALALFALRTLSEEFWEERDNIDRFLRDQRHCLFCGTPTPRRPPLCERHLRLVHRFFEDEESAECPAKQDSHQEVAGNADHSI